MATGKAQALLVQRQACACAGCLATPGFSSHSFSPGRLEVVDEDRFCFDWEGEREKTYHRLPSRALLNHVLGHGGASTSATPRSGFGAAEAKDAVAID